MTPAGRSTPLPPTVGDPQALRADLLAWYGRVRRDLPWRPAGSLYATWVSEVMLQQTTVAAVIPFYLRFMARFPDVGALAAASEQEVLACWSGLGYYSRARNLHRAARLVVERDGGALPATREAWAALPGIGAYTSGAIASIGLGLRVPAVDANARRVITRWIVGDPDELRSVTAAAVQRAAAELADGPDPGTWNQAVMELGALVCRAEAPRCADCPVRAHCRAHRCGLTDRVPGPAVRPPLVDAVLAVLVVLWAGRVLLTRPGSGPAIPPLLGHVLVREDFRGLQGGLWSLPTTAWHGNPPTAGRADAPSALADPAIWSGFLGEVAGPAALRPATEVCGTVRHAITRHRLHVVVHRVVLADPDGATVSAAGNPAKKDLKGEGKPVYNSQGLAGQFFPIPPGSVPVSRLVTKCLQAAGCAAG